MLIALLATLGAAAGCAPEEEVASAERVAPDASSPRSEQAEPRRDARDAQVDAAPATDAAEPALGEAERFVRQAAQINHLVIQASQSARADARREEVAKLADELIAAHRRAERALGDAGQLVDIVVPHNLDIEHAQDVAELERTSEERFDDVFLLQLQIVHEEAILIFEEHAESGEEEALARYAQATLPILRRHLGQVYELRGRRTEESGAVPAGEESAAPEAEQSEAEPRL